MMYPNGFTKKSGGGVVVVAYLEGVLTHWLVHSGGHKVALSIWRSGANHVTTHTIAVPSDGVDVGRVVQRC